MDSSFVCSSSILDYYVVNNGVYVMSKFICFLLVISALNITCSTNSLGVKTCRDDKGNVITSRTNSIGVTTYRDNKGKKIRCRTNLIGVTRCS